ncbi:MAG: hypothetical protein EBW25_02835, partial [Actinobacteria bacterium]|nr:hypothetical protein [Actinomycetota bacterium]
MKTLKIPTNRGSRYFDLNGVIYVIVYSEADLIKLMPIKNNAIIDVWEVEDFKKFLHVCGYLQTTPNENVAFTPGPFASNYQKGQVPNK